ncbi:MAG: Swt1 family HEPN domain-containing protein [Candidatus Freyarchaeum deiterrae]
MIFLPIINEGLFQELQRNTGKSKPRIYQMIQEKRREYGYSISKETAAALLAASKGIDISKFLEPEELVEVRNLIKGSGTLSPTGVVSKPHTEPLPKAVKSKRGELLIEGFTLPENIANDSEKMSKVYSMIYVLENALRYLVISVLEKNCGKDWWENKVSPNIRKNVEGRIRQEDKNRWHSKRGAQKIFYTDFGDLNLIIVGNWKDFKDLFPNQMWIQSRLNEIELSRNIIAHNNSLPNKEIKRIEMYSEDLKKQLADK